MSIQITDPVFGSLVPVHDYAWEKVEPITLVGHAITVAIERPQDQATPDDAQRAVYKPFQAKQEQLVPILQEAIFAHYQSVCEEYRDAIDDEEEADEDAPRLTESQEIWRLVEPSSIYIPRQDAETIHSLNYDFSIGWHSTWDTEHGLQVGFRNWQVSVVDFPRY